MPSSSRSSLPAGTASAAPSREMKTYLLHVVVLKIIFACLRSVLAGTQTRFRLAPRFADHVVLRIRERLEQSKKAGTFERVQPRRETDRNISVFYAYQGARADVGSLGKILPGHVACDPGGGDRASQSRGLKPKFWGRKILVVTLHFVVSDI